jgi:hypothetical protein
LDVVTLFDWNFNMLDLIFQNGEFSGGDSSFWGDLTVSVIGGAIGAFIGVLGAVYVYYKQTIDASKQREYEQYELKKNKINYTQLLLDKISRFNEYTIPELEKLLKRKYLSPLNDSGVAVVPMATVSELGAIQRGDYYLPFVELFDSEDPQKDYNAVMRIFSDHFFLYEETLKLINNEVLRVHEIKENYKREFNNAADMISRLGIEAKKLHIKEGTKSENDDLIKFGNDFLTNFHLDDSRKSDLEFTQILVRDLLKAYVDKDYFINVRQELAPLFFDVANSLKKLGLLHSESAFHIKTMSLSASNRLELLTNLDVLTRKMRKRYKIKPFIHSTPKFFELVIPK